MNRSSRKFRLHLTLLTGACVSVIGFGLLLVLAPALGRQGFALMIYSDPDHIGRFGPDAVRYITLTHAVLGATMAGWGLSLLFVARRLVAHGSRTGWGILSGSLLAWFVPDTLFSLLSGFWQNALLNVAFALLFAIPLAGLRTALDPTRKAEIQETAPG